MRLGAGIKVKVLEAMSAGVPVLTNDIGIEGIGCRNGREYWHCQRAEEYADRILWMEEHTCEAAKIAENGRKYIEENFDLEKKYGYSELDSMLVLKDILASVWKGRRKNGR